MKGKRRMVDRRGAYDLRNAVVMAGIERRKKRRRASDRKVRDERG